MCSNDFIMAKMNKAIDEVRAAEAKRLKKDGYDHVLKHSRWCLLKRKENLTEKQIVKLKELLKYNLQAVRLLAERGLPTLLGIPLTLLGCLFPGGMVPSQSLADRTDEESGADFVEAWRANTELVSSQGSDFSRDGRRLELQR